MDKYVSTLKNRILQEVHKVEKMECGMKEKSELIIPLLEKRIEGLKIFISDYSFKDEAEEIYFFKEIKPQFLSLLVYYVEVYNIEMRIPAGSHDDKICHLSRVQSRIKYFFDMNIDFYQYYRTGSTYLDHLYFLRGKVDLPLHYDSFSFERNTSFSTCCDYKLAKILANEMLASYLDTELAKLAHGNNLAQTIHSLHSDAIWTEKKNALGEIIYGIDTLESVNRGSIEIKELAAMLGKLFNVDMSDIYHVYLAIRNRKGDRTEYLNRMIKALNKRMDNADNK